MIERPPPLGAVLAAVGAPAETARTALESHAERSPWYVRLLVGGVAWLAALTVLGYVATTGLIDEDAYAPWGAVAAAVAIGLARWLPRDDAARGAGAEFGAQIALVLSLVARLLILIGLGDWTDGNWMLIGTALALLESLLLGLYPDGLQRFVAAGLGGVWLLLSLGDVDNTLTAAVLRDATTLAAALGAGAFWLARARLAAGPRGDAVEPVGYGLAAFVLAACLEDTIGVFGLAPPGLRWLATAGMASGLLAVLWTVRSRLGRPEIDASAAVLGVIVVAVAGATWAEPGIVAALGVLVLAFAARDAVLYGLGVVGLAATLWHYFYGMRATMLEKSALLVAAGLLLLGGRWLWRVAVARSGDDDGTGASAAAAEGPT